MAATGSEFIEGRSLGSHRLHLDSTGSGSEASLAITLPVSGRELEFVVHGCAVSLMVHRRGRER